MGRSSRGALVRRFAVLAPVFVLTAALWAQSEPAAGGDDKADRRARRSQNGDGRPNFNPEEMQQRIANALREQLGITDDAEWKLVSDRITAVTELRRGAAGGFGAFRGPGGSASSVRGGRGGNPEQDALRQAVADRLPDAEIKARLTRLREVRRMNEEKLTKAQEELRAVLTLRQEAVAVMFGLLP